MSRLPIPGSDNGSWGNVLNDFLAQEHNADGTQKTLPISKGGTGAIDATTARTNLGTISSADSRLSDARTPLTHKSTHATGASDALAPSDIGAVAKGDLVLNVKDYGAKGNGTTDDTAAIQSAINAAAAAGGGRVLLASGLTFKTTQTLLLNASNLVLWAGPGSTIKFVPTAPFVSGVNDRAILIAGTASAIRPVSGSIAAGATSFTAQNAADTTDLGVGDWVIVSETDSGAGEIVLIEWAQVLSVSGTTVNFQHPIRTAFPATGGGRTLSFRRVTSLVENCELHGVSVLQPAAAQSNPSFAVGISRSTQLYRCTANNAKGNGFYSYQASDLTVIGCHQVADLTQATEFAATTDLVIEGCSFGTFGSANTGQTQPNSSALVLDFGTAFFTVSGSRFPTAGDICIQLSYIHDGEFFGNTVGWVRRSSIDGIGINALGCQRVQVIANTFAGGDGATGKAIAFADSSTFTTQIVSQDNLIAFNRISGFANQYATMSAKDVYLIFPASATSHLAIPGWLGIGAATDPVQPLDVLGNTRLTGLLGVNLNPVATSGRLQVADDPVTQDLVSLQSTNGSNPRTFKLGPGTGGGTVFGLYDATGTTVAWQYNWSTKITTLAGALSALGATLTKALNTARVALTYGATIATDASLGNEFDITATNGTAFTISNPTNATDGQVITYTIRNTSGGALGAITWGTAFKMAAWTSPATANSRSITFRFDGTNLVEISRTPGDVPN